MLGSSSMIYFPLFGLSQPPQHQVLERRVDDRTNPLFKASPVRLPEGNGAPPWADSSGFRLATAEKTKCS